MSILRTIALILMCVLCAPVRSTERPNILVIVADDLGYADVGFQGCKDIPTPNLDALAMRSVRCSNGYVTHPFCSPTRAGLLTGRYQHRFGHENNPAWLPESTVAGLPLAETTLPQTLKTAGYHTNAIGKWHLGAHPQFHPNRRGFEFYFGLLGGGHNYFPADAGSAEYAIPMDRNGKPERLGGYLTEVLGKEAATAVAKKQESPWFLYLAFNAPHTPLHVTDALSQRAAHISDETRRGYAGLVMGLDDAIGRVLKSLRDSGQEDNTLVFFFSDNGGPVGVTHANNSPLRGAKGQVFEGGVRVPFLVSWPAALAKNTTYDHPVSSLDVFATSVAVSGATVPTNHVLEGTNLVPHLKGEKSGAPHDSLFWRTAGGATWAVRQGNWKLVNFDSREQLYDLATDIGETADRASTQPEIVQRLKLAYNEWNQKNISPVFESPGAGRARKNPGPAKAVVQ